MRHDLDQILSNIRQVVTLYGKLQCCALTSSQPLILLGTSWNWYKEGRLGIAQKKKERHVLFSDSFRDSRHNLSIQFSSSSPYYPFQIDLIAERDFWLSWLSCNRLVACIFNSVMKLPKVGIDKAPGKYTDLLLFYPIINPAFSCSWCSYCWIFSSIHFKQNYRLVKNVQTTVCRSSMYLKPLYMPNIV